MYFKLEKPNIEEIPKQEVLKFLSEDTDNKLVTKTFFPEYLYWDKAKYKELPKKWKPELYWAAVKLLRKEILNSRKSVIVDEKNKPFTWIASLPWYDEFQHEIDMNLGGALLGIVRDLDDDVKRKYVTRGVMEEAIASSQLEGANTTRKVAKEMIREGRKPRTLGEKMILNNYQSMQYTENTLKSRKLSLDVLKDLHVMLTKDTLQDKNDEGKLRTDSDEIVVHNEVEGTIYHVTPKEVFMKSELNRLIAYANDELNDDGFVHPVIKATFIHFWIGYLHPFVDGNGRLARTLFYWYLLKHGYWGFAYLPLSKVIKNSPEQYKMAYIYTEQDDNDLTYFVDYNASKIIQSIGEFRTYEKETRLSNTAMVKTARMKYHLNDRQIQLIRYYWKNRDSGVSIASHMNVNEISRATAISDLQTLERNELVIKKKTGRVVYYYATEKIEHLFK